VLQHRSLGRSRTIKRKQIFLPRLVLQKKAVDQLQPSNKVKKTIVALFERFILTVSMNVRLCHFHVSLQVPILQFVLKGRINIVCYTFVKRMMSLVVDFRHFVSATIIRLSMQVICVVVRTDELTNSHKITTLRAFTTNTICSRRAFLH
jgi:hypothetical protein